MTLCNFDNCVQGSASHEFDAKKCGEMSDNPEIMSSDLLSGLDGPDTEFQNKMSQYGDQGNENDIIEKPISNNLLIVSLESKRKPTLEIWEQSSLIGDNPILDQEFQNPDIHDELNAKANLQFMKICRLWCSIEKASDLIEKPMQFLIDLEKDNIIAPYTIGLSKSRAKLSCLPTTIQRTLVNHLVTKASIQDLKQIEWIILGLELSLRTVGPDLVNKAISAFELEASKMEHQRQEIIDSSIGITESVEGLREENNKLAKQICKLEVTIKLQETQYIKSLSNLPFNPPDNIESTKVTKSVYVVEGKTFVLNDDQVLDTTYTKSKKFNPDMTVLDREIVDALGMLGKKTLQGILWCGWNQIKEWNPSSLGLTAHQRGTEIFQKFKSSNIPVKPLNITLVSK